MDISQRPDAALVKAALAGDREAFSILVRRHQDYAYGVAVGLLSDFELARDVVQEAFLCAYRDLPRLKSPARFGGWLRGIVRHTAHRALRELARVRSMAEELRRTVEPFARTVLPDRSAEEAERRETVRRALERLNDRNREAVSLYYVDGFSYAEIAEFLGVTKATVQGRLQRARSQLRRELKMVEETFKEQELPTDFSAEIRRLLDAAATRGEEHERAIERLAEIGVAAVGPLCEALSDARAPVRRAAARALCAIGDARALSPILRLLYVDEAWQAELFRSGRVLAVPGVREALLDIVREGKKYGESYWAIHALSHATGDTEVYDCFYQVFRNPSGDRPRLLARVALGALCDVRPEAAADVIVEALDGPDLQLRGAAAWEAVRRGVLPSVEAPLKAFVTGVNWWGRVCAGNLVSEHGKKGERVLRELMATGSDAERATAAMALARTGAKEAFDVLKEELLSGQHDRHWVEAVSQTLASRYGQQLFDWIEGQGRVLASMPVVTWTLAKSRATSAGPMIGELFREGTPAVRAGAVRILARQRGPAFLPELRRCLREGPRKVAQEAFWQMYRLGQAAMPTVEAMLASDHWTERKAAVCLLRRWGKLTPKLKARADSDSHVAVRHAANWHPVIAMHHD